MNEQFVHEGDALVVDLQETVFIDEARLDEMLYEFLKVAVGLNYRQHESSKLSGWRGKLRVTFEVLS